MIAGAGDAPVGFSVVLPAADGAVELDGLFVDPEAMGRGLGRRLAQDAIARARRDGARRIDVIANPRAEGFYARLRFAPGEAVATRFDTAPDVPRAVGRPYGLHYFATPAARM